MIYEKTDIGNEKICPVAVLEKDNKILIGLRNYTLSKWKTLSVRTCPGGRCEYGENVEEALRREVEEEVGIKNLEIVSFLGDIPGAKEGDIVPVFHCKTDQDFTNKEPGKFSEWRWVDIENFPENFINQNLLILLKDIFI